MKHLLNTLFVTSEDIYLSLDGENVVASRERQEVARYPLHTLSGIISFSYPGASPALMGACASRDISLAFCTPRGRFLARVTGKVLETCCCAAPSIGRRTIPGVVVPSRGAWSLARYTTPAGASNAPSGSRPARGHGRPGRRLAHLKGLLPQIAEETSWKACAAWRAGAAVYFGALTR